MSLAICATTSEGKVLASDSRQSYRNRKGMARIGSDNASKLFHINERIGLAVTGLAFLPEEGVPKNISKFIEEFKRETDVKELGVYDVAKKLHYLFNKKYTWQKNLDDLLQNVKNDLQLKGCEVVNIKKEKSLVKFQFKDPKGNLQTGVAGVDVISLLAAGFDNNGSYKAFICNIPGEISKKKDSTEQGKEYGASWIGQSDVVQRIVLGYDGRIRNIKFVQESIQKYGMEEVNHQLRNLEYAIQYGTMTLQDAVDFCTLIIQTTSAIQRFSDGIVADPGDIPGVGGPVDVALISQDNGFVWLSKKNLKYAENEIDFDKVPKIKYKKSDTKIIKKEQGSSG